MPPLSSVDQDMAAHIVYCPNCAKQVEWLPQNNWRPFCSERCKMIDLGAWAEEQYKVPGSEMDMVAVSIADT
jgi:hypothetical protein